MELFSLIFFLSVYYVFLVWKSKYDFYELRKQKQPILAKVEEFRERKMPKRNRFLKCPYVRFTSENGESKLVKIYSDSVSRSLQIGDIIEVFSYGGILYYWESYNKGWLKYLPIKMG